MIVSICNSCLSGFRISVTADVSHLISQLMDSDGLAPCPKGCGGKINLIGDPSIDSLAHGATMMDLTAAELYRALNGGGLPTEIPQSPELIESLLKAHPVIDVLVEGHGDRVYLHELRLKNGNIIHLTAGGRGAKVLKVTRTT